MNKMRCEFQSFVYKAGIRSFWSFQNLKKQFQNCVNVLSKAPSDMMRGRQFLLRKLAALAQIVTEAPTTYYYSEYGL